MGLNGSQVRKFVIKINKDMWFANNWNKAQYKIVYKLYVYKIIYKTFVLCYLNTVIYVKHTVKRSQ